MAAYLCLNCGALEDRCDCSYQAQDLITINDMPREINDLRAQRDKLRAALEDIVRVTACPKSHTLAIEALKP